MGFWGSLGHILAPIGKAAGYAAAPFTGGLSLLAEPAIGAAEGALSDANHDGKKDGWSGALKGGAIGGLEAAIPYGVGKALGPALSSTLGNTLGKVTTPILGNMTTGAVNKLGAKNGVSPTRPITGGVPGGAANFGGGGGGGYENPVGFDENGNYTNDPSQAYQDLDGNVLDSSNSGGGYGPGYQGPTQDSGMTGDWQGPVSPGGSSSGGTGVIQKILNSIGGGNKAGNLTDLGKTLGSFSQAEANNRSTTGNFMQGYDRLALAAQTGRNQNESDALKKLAQTSYLQNGGSHFQLPSFQLNGQMRTPVDFGIGPSPASAAQKQAASTLQGQLLQRLAPGGSVMPTDPKTYTQPGVGENIGKWGALITGGLGALGGIFGDQPQPVPGQPTGRGPLNIPQPPIPGQTPPYV